MPGSATTTGAPSDLAFFLKALAEEGRAVVSARPLATNSDDALSVLSELDQLARVELALAAPAFSANAALWAAQLLYHLCQFTVCRDLGEEQIAAACSVPCPEPRGPEADWSVDLSLRHLPKLFELARHVSQGDPLLQQMKRIASAWPLSSVGISGLETLEFGPCVAHPALLRLYADRIFATGDETRLSDLRVADRLRADLGLHRELGPAIAERLHNTTHDTH